MCGDDSWMTSYRPSITLRAVAAGVPKLLAEHDDAIARLERWWLASHQRSVKIDTYGDANETTCWVVTLHQDGTSVSCSELHVWELDGDPKWHVDDNGVMTCVAIDGPPPGLAATINCALDAAVRYWGDDGR